jgi:two-component system OmpR family sensor kinase
MRLPIRARLAVVTGALVAALLLALAAFVYLRLRVDLLEAVDAGLVARADTLLAASNGGLGSAGGLIEADEAFAQLITLDGLLIDSSVGLGGQPLLTPAMLDEVRAGSRFLDAEVRTTEEVVPARLLAVPASGGRVLVVGSSLEDQHAALDRLLVLLTVGGPIGVVVAGGIGWLIAGRALSPVDRMRAEAEAISASEPERILAVPRTGDELARLAESLNRMLGRLQAAVDRERRFVSDASHELRTPLASLKAELELALRGERSSDELIVALRSALDEADRVTRLAEDLLVLARTDGGRVPVRRESVDLAGLARDAAAPFADRARDRDVVLETPGVRVSGNVDPMRIRQAIANLVDNALRHTPPGGRVTITVERQDGVLGIEVSDTGDGFPPDFIARAFEPFSRADPSRARPAGGTGLGLAIVRAIAEAHGGSAEASNRPGNGGLVRLRLQG